VKPARIAGAAALVAAAALHPGRLVAGPDGEVASAFDPGDPLDVHASIDYRYSSRRSSLKRELDGLPGADPNGPTPLVKDLVFEGTRHELVPRVEVGLYTDLALTVELPLVLRDARRLRFDQRADDCVFATDPGVATCVDAANSTTIADGILPADGLDAEDGGATGGATVFRGVTRAGLDQLHLGLVWAPTNQARDPSKPTWKLGTELRVAIGDVMEVDAASPAREDGVSRGVHELRLFTSMTRRVGWAEPFFEAWWMGAIGARGRSPLDGPTRNFDADDVGPQQRAGGRFGLELIPWERPARDQRIALELGADIEAMFAGRAYSDMWEVFALAGGPGGPLQLDADPETEGQQPLPHPGVTNVEESMTLAATAAIEAHLATWLRLDLGLRLAWDQSHLITTATTRDNPLQAPLIDQVGHRYRLDESLTYVLTTGLRLLY